MKTIYRRHEFVLDLDWYFQPQCARWQRSDFIEADYHARHCANNYGISLRDAKRRLALLPLVPQVADQDIQCPLAG
jgi:hypothetical protein